MLVQVIALDRSRALGRSKAVGRHTRSACRPDAVESFAPAASVLPNSQLQSYRAAVDDLVTEAGPRWGSSGPLTMGAFVAERLKQPEFAAVLARLDGGVDGVADRGSGLILQRDHALDELDEPVAGGEGVGWAHLCSIEERFGSGLSGRRRNWVCFART